MLDSGESDRSWDACEDRRQPRRHQSGTVLGRPDHDGTGDTPIAVTVVLERRQRRPLASTTTDANGNSASRTHRPVTHGQTNQRAGYTDVSDIDGG
ncbi:MAG: hypothetical protein IPQ01_09125 [Zoogloea sp.]|nr:hypothetical protein [Zoogloea sp.]